MDRSFWRNRRVLVTGHTGFKGSWLCLWLHSLGARVAGYALAPPTRPSLYELARVGELVESTIADLRDMRKLEGVVASFAPEIVIHMAAQSVVLASYEDPIETYSTNVIGTVHVLEAIRRMKRPCCVVNVTTDKCYLNQDWVWGYREVDALGGRDPYSNSKACAELVAQSFRHSFFPLESLSQHGIALASARAGNVIGGGDWTAHQLIPESVAAFARAEPVILRHPEGIRPWQHVLDCLNGYLMLAERLASLPTVGSGEWNFGPAPTDTYTVARVVEVLAAHWNIATPWVRAQGVTPREERELTLDSTKANRVLGWQCRLSTERAIAWVAEWYLGLQQQRDARLLCLSQIGRFAELEAGA
jgi:CDP-glucose 4,6-dehydratase